MAVPTPTFEDTDFSNAGNWTLFNGATTSADPFGTTQLNGVNINTRATYLGANPIADGSGSQHSVSCWFSSNNTGTQAIMAQRDKGGSPLNSVWDMLTISGGALNCAFYSSTNAANGISSSSSLSYNDGVVRHIVITANGNDLNIYINGLEIAYNTQDNQQGAGFTGVPASNGNPLSALGFTTNGFGLPGSCTRPKAWQGTTLTPAEVAEEYTNECAFDVTPATTDEFLNLTTATFTPNGSPVVTDGPFTFDSTYEFDGVNDYLTTSITPISNSSGSIHSYSLWIKNTSSNQTGFFIAQNDGVSGNIAFSLTHQNDAASNRLGAQFNSTDSNNNVTSFISAGERDWDDGEFHHIVITVNGSDCNIYIDGVEAAYNQENLTSGTGFGGVSSSVTTLTIGANGVGGNFVGAGTVPARPKFWEGIELSPCEVLNEFIAEAATEPSEEITLPDETVERLDIWETNDPGLLRVGTVTEPFLLGDTLSNASTSGQTLTSGQITRLNEWGQLDPALSIAGDSVAPFFFGDILNDAMGTPPISTQLTAEQIEVLNDWELSDPGLANVQTPENEFNMGDALNALLTRT